MSTPFIDLEEGEDDVCFVTQRPSPFGRRRRRSSSCTIIDESPSSSGAAVDEVIDLTVELGTSGHRLLNEGEFVLEKIRAYSSIVQPGVFLEVREFFAGNYLVEFVLVKIVVRCRESGAVKIRGIPFTRARAALGKLPKKSNEKLEVCFTGQGSRKKQCEESLVHIHSSEVPETRYRISEDILSNRWRGGRVRGGSWMPSRSIQDYCIDLEATGPGHTKKRTYGQKYTMFDSCSGAGGVSRGAKMAGFKVQYAVDKAPEVWDTYETNFPDTELFKMSLDQFLSDDRTGHMRVDVLHFSPPCQFFSPAHTHASAQDDDNIFALYSCNQLLKKLRPRIITVEQTFGLTHDRHAEYFHAFLGDFTQFGYSVRWKVVRLCTWGAAQDRKRLIIIAAAPGERLPPFPEATHSDDGQDGLLPYNTIGKALRGIRPGDDLHDLNNVRRYQPRRAPYDPNRLAGTITTRGGDFYYPDGTRNLTLREFASLQGFPKTHQFLGTMTSIKRQIGNAFPPNTVSVLYKHVEQWLLKQDGVSPYDPRDDTILVDDESDATATTIDVSEDEVRPSPEMMEATVMDMSGNSQNGRARAGWRSEAMVIDLT
ncbi:dna (cytosine-5-)-methyltransferase [Fusarium albosuccineum]|uniref:DNA (cytosine-5-)-methyltransferase n=1 Tax=Fusarium albosuccineum TaxID=1237068 RepID=A0A8H4LBE7_9HYPO|nr:dna (cytosine-5-)-methyltransferase [Fusarium albosuccineum]